MIRPYMMRRRSGITEIAVTSGTLHIATKDGEAMFFHDSLDFSEYAGSGKKITFIDSAGVEADAYCYTAGGGEALGSELITGWTNNTDSASYSYETFVSSGSTITSAINTSGAGIAYQEYSSIAGELLLLDIDLTLNSATDPPQFGFWGAKNGSAVQDQILLSSGGNQHYVTTAAGGNYVSLYINKNIDFSSTNSLKKLTDIPTTGLHLVSEAGGTTRNMASVESGFDPNDIVQVNVTG